MKILGIIPARYASTRFPGKPLALISGKSMIQRVYEQACKSSTLARAVVATDDERIFSHVKSFGGEAVMTSARHPNGTARCAEALGLVKGNFQAVVNIQGDEPFIHPRQIDLVAKSLEEGAPIATLVKRITDRDEFLSRSIVKAVVGKNGQALYFSRSPVPFTAGDAPADIFRKKKFYRHLGIYGYRKSALKAIVRLPPSPLEEAESLEQLRWLENGYKIMVKETRLETLAIDTPADLEKISGLKRNSAHRNR